MTDFNYDFTVLIEPIYNITKEDQQDLLHYIEDMMQDLRKQNKRVEK